MNNTQISAIRNLWNDLNTQPETRTASEMALEGYKVWQDVITTKDGKKYAWNKTSELFVRFH